MTVSPPTTTEVVDPRGPRFAAAITSVVLAASVALGPTAGLPLLILQTVAFASGALLGVRFQPYGWLFRVAIRPRLAPPAELEDARPPRFAQAVGLGFAVAGLVGGVFNLAVLFFVAVGFALVAALLNAVFDYCLGCELYLLGKRLSAKPAAKGA